MKLFFCFGRRKNSSKPSKKTTSPGNIAAGPSNSGAGQAGLPNGKPSIFCREATPDLTVATDEGNKVVPQDVLLQVAHEDQPTPAPESTTPDVAINDDDDDDDEHPCARECSSSLLFGPTFKRTSDFLYQPTTWEG